VRRRDGGAGLLRPRRRRVLGASVGYDPRGFLHVALTNNGRRRDDVELELAIPADAGPGWLARVDAEGHPQMESGAFRRDGELLRWTELLSLEPGETLLRFFVGVAAAPGDLPVVVRAVAPHGFAFAFASTVSRTTLT